MPHVLFRRRLSMAAPRKAALAPPRPLPAVPMSDCRLALSSFFSCCLRYASARLLKDASVSERSRPALGTASRAAPTPGRGMTAADCVRDRAGVWGGIGEPTIPPTPGDGGIGFVKGARPSAAAAGATPAGELCVGRRVDPGPSPAPARACVRDRPLLPIKAAAPVGGAGWAVDVRRRIMPPFRPPALGVGSVGSRPSLLSPAGAGDGPSLLRRDASWDATLPVEAWLPCM